MKRIIAIVALLLSMVALGGIPSVTAQGVDQGIQSVVSQPERPPAQATATPAPGPTEVPTPPPTTGGVLVVGVPGDAGLWDPKYSSNTNAIEPEQNLFATLMQNTADSKSVEPWLAESYEVSPDLRVTTFKLHQNAKFCDGTPIMASDVKFTFDRALEKDSNVTWQFAKGTKIEVVDDYTVKITVDDPLIWFPQAVTLWGTDIVSEKYTKSMTNEQLAEKPLGSGPFCLASWDKGAGYTFKRNPGYWGRPAYLDEVQVKVIQDDTARVLQLETGDIDIALDIPANQVDSLSGFPGVKGYVSKLWGSASIALNERAVPAFKDKKVRQAMSYAIDRQALVDTLLFGKGEMARSPFYGTEIPYWTGDFGYDFNLDKAKQLMAESTFPNGFETEMIYASGNTLATQVGIILKDQLSKIGVNVKLQPVEEGTWFSKWSSYDYQMVYKLGTNLVLDPDQNIPFDMLQVEDGGQGAAWTGWSNAEVTQLTKAARSETDPKKRGELYYQVQKIVMDEAPQIWLFHPNNLWGARDNVYGFKVYPTGLYRYWDVWKTQ